MVTGLLEPAYEVAGDAFDYALNDDRLHVAVFDGMGHGIASTLLSTLAVGAYRHARRNGEGVTSMQPRDQRGPWSPSTTAMPSSPVSSPVSTWIPAS